MKVSIGNLYFLILIPAIILLIYYSIKKLREVSGHSSDYILYGLDDKAITETRELLKNYSEAEIVQALEVIQKLSKFIKNA